MSILELLPISLRGEVKYEKQKIEKTITEKNFNVCDIYTSSDTWRGNLLRKEKRETFVHFKEMSDGNVCGKVTIYDPKRNETERIRIF